MRLLEELWYGNIEPTEYDNSPCKECREVLQLISRNEEKLRATMTDEQKERLDQELLEQYLTGFREYAEDLYCIPFYKGYTVAYAWPLWGEPAVMLITLHEGMLRSQTISWREDDWREDEILWYSDILSHSWYHFYSNTIYIG